MTTPYEDLLKNLTKDMPAEILDLIRQLCMEESTRDWPVLQKFMQQLHESNVSTSSVKAMAMSLLDRCYLTELENGRDKDSIAKEIDMVIDRMKAKVFKESNQNTEQR